MPVLFNTVNSNKFYNFVSNKFPFGVYPSGLSAVSDPFLITDWVTTYALPTSSELNTGVLYYYFKPVVNTPTENESCSGNPTAHNNYRFSLGLTSDYTITHNSPASVITLNSQNKGTPKTLITSITNPAHVTATVQSGSNRHSTFGVCTPSTMALVTFELNDTNDKKLTNFTMVNIHIAGWLSEGLFASPFDNPNSRYNNCFVRTYRYVQGLLIDSGNARQPSITGTTSSTECREPRYYDINCLSGSYTPGLFLTDCVVQDTLTPFAVRGKIDNNAICIGRGTFEVGKVYRATNIFGRTGDEDWLCVMPFMSQSASVSSTTWTKGNSHLLHQRWSQNENDYLLIRIYTEVD